MALGVVIIGSLLTVVVVDVIAAAVTGARIDRLPYEVGIGANYALDGVLIACAVGFARFLGGRPTPRLLGLCRPPLLQAAGLLVAAGVAVFVFSLIWGEIAHLKSQEDLTKKLGIQNGTGALVAIAVLVCVVAPISEETFFRGFFFGAVRNWRGVWPAAAITGVVFGAVHVGSYSVAYLPPLAFLGFALCIVRWRTGSLYPCIALHAMNNGLAFAVLRHWTWWQVVLMMLASLVVSEGLVLAVARISQRSSRGSRTI